MPEDRLGTRESKHSWGALRAWFAALENPDDGESRLFFIIVVVVLGAVAIFEVNVVPALSAPGRWIPFLVLMALHIALYWFSPRFSKDLRQTWGYLAVQAVFVLVLTRFPRDLGIVLSLYPALLGIAVGMLHERRQAVLGIVLWFALATFNLVLNLGFDALSTWLLFAPPLALFVVIYVVLYMRQMKARSHAQTLLRELEVANRELNDYAARVEALTLTAERRRMARELHDTLAQGVAGLILQLEAVDSHLAQGNVERAQGIVQQAMARSRSTLAEARDAIDDLRDMSSDFDLEEALRERIARFTEATGVPCAFDWALSISLSAPLAEHVQRMVAEGLSNVARHAQASHAWVSVEEDGGGLVVEVRDDGVGFDAASALTQPGHYGLLGLRERARLAGGALDIESAPGSGTRLTVRAGRDVKE